MFLHNILFYVSIHGYMKILDTKCDKISLHSLNFLETVFAIKCNVTNNTKIIDILVGTLKNNSKLEISEI